MDIINKNSLEAETCLKYYNSYLEGLNYQTKDTFFFSYILQFILVFIMYSYVGSGKYWKILLYASISGLIGALIEHSTLAYICQKNQRDRHTKVVPFFIEEFFWILCEYSIPVLNLIKIEALANGKLVKIIKGVILTLLIPFSMARLYDGYDRMMKGYLNTDMSRICHGIAFGVMAFSDLICTSSIILYTSYQYRKSMFQHNFIMTSIKNSSYTVLVVIDFVSLLLSILYVLSTFLPHNTTFRSSATLFHCIKSVFILVLGIDALIFKYEMNGCNVKSPHLRNNHYLPNAIHTNKSYQPISSMSNIATNVKQKIYVNSSNNTLSASLDKYCINSSSLSINKQILTDKKKE